MKFIEFIKTGMKFYFLMFLGGLFLLFIFYKSHKKKVIHSTSYLVLLEYIPNDSLWRDKDISSIDFPGNYCENLRDEPHKAIYDVKIIYETDKQLYVRYFMEQKDDSSNWVIVKKEVDPHSRIFNGCD